MSSLSVAFASVGVSDGKAAAPTSGAAVAALTTTLPTAWILRPPTGSARTQYLPGLSSFKCETNTSCTSPGSGGLPGTPTGSDVAVVSANGFAFKSSASQIFAVGRVTTRPWPSTTRNVKRTVPGPKSDVPGTIATSSPGARQSDSSVCDVSSVVVASGSSCAEEEPPQPAAIKQAARAKAAA